MAETVPEEIPLGGSRSGCRDAADKDIRTVDVSVTVEQKFDREKRCRGLPVTARVLRGPLSRVEKKKNKTKMRDSQFTV